MIFVGGKKKKKGQVRLDFGGKGLKVLGPTGFKEGTHWGVKARNQSGKGKKVSF